MAEKKAAPKAPKKETPKAEKPKAEKAAAPSAAPTEAGPSALQRRAILTGLVVSDKMQKTIVVRVERRVRHGMYGKYMNSSQRYKAHDEKNTAKTGDLVSIIQSRPLSKEKRWVLREIIRKASPAQVLETV
jgi:small subunit ribosomal protein S17